MRKLTKENLKNVVGGRITLFKPKSGRYAGQTVYLITFNGMPEPNLQKIIIDEEEWFPNSCYSSKFEAQKSVFGYIATSYEAARKIDLDLNFFDIINT